MPGGVYAPTVLITTKLVSVILIVIDLIDDKVHVCSTDARLVLQACPCNMPGGVHAPTVISTTKLVSVI